MVLYQIIIILIFSRILGNKIHEHYEYAKLFSATVRGQTKGCVSYMMPVFNKAKYLNRSIGSILGQNYKCLEVIAINDASTDNSLDILNYWTKQDKRVIVHTLAKNKGIMLARIEGVLLSYYDYLFSIDPDDELPANSLKDYINYAIKTNSDMVMGIILANNHNKISTFTWKIIKEDLNRTQMISLFQGCKWGWTIFRLIKRDVFLKGVLLLIDKYYVPIINADDKLLIGATILYSNNYSYYPNPTYIYYQNLPDNSGSKAYSHRKFSNPHSESLVNAFLRTQYPNFRC